MKQYRKRIYDTVLRHHLEAKGAVLVEGPKWCGKTTTCLQLAQSVLYMAQPDIREQNIMLTDMQPSLLLQGATPRLIDEWQIAPKLWDAVRFEADQRDEFNQFLLTGSSVPPSFTDITHTGTGRKKYSFLRICLRGIQICAPRVQYALQIPDILSIPPSQRQH